MVRVVYRCGRCVSGDGVAGGGVVYTCGKCVGGDGMAGGEGGGV
jgi:hypothetical protein